MVEFSDVYDKDGNISRLNETPGRELAMVISSKGGIFAIRVAAGTYVGTDGKVYSTIRNNCILYSTQEWLNWARRQLQKLNCQPTF